MGLHNGPYRHSTKKLDNRQQGRLEPRTTDGQLRSGRRYQCDNTIPNISTGIAKLSNKKKNKKGSRAFSILNLPRELRDEIYRELLLADKIRSTNIITGKATFEPVILRVNKQLHEEGSRILYYENKWLIITMNRYDLTGFYVQKKYSIVSQSIRSSNRF